MIINSNKLFNTENKRLLIINFVSLAFLRGGQLLIPLISLPYLVRIIGFENFGLLSFSLSVGLYFGTVIQYGFGITAVREIARNRGDVGVLNKIYSVTLSASILLVLACLLLFSIVILWFEKFNSYRALYIFSFTFVVFQSLFPIWFFQGMEKMRYITFLSLGNSLLYLMTLFGYVRQEQDFVLVPLLQTISSMLTLVVAMCLIKFQFKISYEVPSWNDIKSVYKEGRHAFLSQLAPNLYNNTSTFLLGLFASNSVVGSYAAATRVIGAVSSLGHILSNTFLPSLSRSMNLYTSFQLLMIGSGLFLTIMISILSEWIVSILFGNGGEEVTVYIKWLAIGILPLFATMTYGTNFLMLVGKDKLVKDIVLFTSLIFFGVALVSIPLWGIWGVICTIVGARLVIAIFQYYFYLKY